jgi:hypothetical protein
MDNQINKLGGGEKAKYLKRRRKRLMFQISPQKQKILPRL